MSAPTQTRPLHVIARDIRRDWRPPFFGAVPYLDAMASLDGMGDRYYQEDAATIVAYFLTNAATWRGETARAVKAELRAMQKAHKANRGR